MRRLPAVILLLVVASCGPRTVQRATETLKTAQSATNAARSAFIEWDAVHQAALVERATSADDATKALEDYRQRRAAVIRSFAITYSSIAAAVSIIPLIERKKRSEAELLVLVIAAADNAKRLAAEIAAFREDP